MISLLPVAARGAPADCQAAPGCRGLLEKGIGEFKRNHFEIAVGFFKEAYANTPDPRLLVFIGRARFKQNRPEEALENYQRAQSEITDIADRTKLEHYIVDARASMGVNAPPLPIIAPPPKPETPATPSPTTTTSPAAPTSPPPIAATPAPSSPTPVEVTPPRPVEPEPPLVAPVAPKATSAPASERKTKPWVWALVGVAAAGVVGTAVGLGVYYGTSVGVPDGMFRFP